MLLMAAKPATIMSLSWTCPCSEKTCQQHTTVSVPLHPLSIQQVTRGGFSVTVNVKDERELANQNDADKPEPSQLMEALKEAYKLINVLKNRTVGIIRCVYLYGRFDKTLKLIIMTSNKSGFFTYVNVFNVTFLFLLLRVADIIKNI